MKIGNVVFTPAPGCDLHLTADQTVLETRIGAWAGAIQRENDMSADGDAPVTHEVVIVRRRSGGEDEGHHGGAWKIAFADLMTAMMTFFLVMWLLNISDKEKITKIATYFNPTKLSDKTPSVKGVHEPQEEQGDVEGADSKEYRCRLSTEPKEDHKAKLEEDKGDGKAKKGDPKKAEEELFNDPYGVLARMALKAMERGELANGGTKQGDELLPGGEAYRNPFEPYAADKPLAEQPAPATPDAGGVEARVSAKTAEAEAAKEAAPPGAEHRPVPRARRRPILQRPRKRRRPSTVSPRTS